MSDKQRGWTNFWLFMIWMVLLGMSFSISAAASRLFELLELLKGWQK